MAYRDRSAFLDPRHAARTRNAIMSPVVAIDGRVAGTWSRATKKDHVALDVTLFARPSTTIRRALEIAADRFGEFLGLAPALEIAIDAR